MVRLDIRLDNRAYHKAKEKIAFDCGIPSNAILLNDYGRFDIHNLSENETINAYGRLRRSRDYKNVTYTVSGYDFNHFSSLGQPKCKFTICGQLIMGENDEI